MSSLRQSPLSVADDAACVARFLAGDAVAGEMLVTKYGAAVKRAVYRHCGSEVRSGIVDFQDVEQEAWVLFFEWLPAWRGDAPIIAILLKIAKRCAMRVGARAHREVTVSLDVPLANDDPDFTLGNMIAADLPLPEDSMMQGALELRVARALCSMGEKTREAMILRYVYGLPRRRIMALTGSSLEAVKTRLRYGVSILKERCGPMLEGVHQTQAEGKEVG